MAQKDHNTRILFLSVNKNLIHFFTFGITTERRFNRFLRESCGVQERDASADRVSRLLCNRVLDAKCIDMYL